MSETQYPIYEPLGNSGLYHTLKDVEHFQTMHPDAVVTAEFLRDVHPRAIQRKGDTLRLNGKTYVIIGMDANPPTEYYAKEAEVF